MHETFSRARCMFANNGLAEIAIKTRELINRYGYSGAKIYLEAQLQTLCDMEEDDVEAEDFGD